MKRSEYEAWLDANTWDPGRDSENVQLQSDLQAADWLRGHLAQGSFNVGMTAPSGYEAYARILYPFTRSTQDTGGSWLTQYETWGELAVRNGRTAHPLMEEKKIDVDASGSPGSRGTTSRLPPDQIAILTSFLSRYTSAQHCWFLIWDGYADLNERVFNSGVPKIRHPMREYFLLKGTLDSFAEFPEDPDYWWPEDQAWCYCTDTDFSWAYLAGSKACISELVALGSVEAYLTSPEDPADDGMDTINP